MPENAISINIEKRTVTASQNFSLNCCAMKTVQGLSSNLTVKWYGPNGDRFSASSMVADPVVTGNKTCVKLQLAPSRRNEYVCKATLLSPVMEQPLVKTAIFREGMQLSLKYNCLQSPPITWQLIFMLACLYGYDGHNFVSVHGVGIYGRHSVL